MSNDFAFLIVVFLNQLRLKERIDLAAFSVQM